jgi:hypothetical protein
LPRAGGNWRARTPTTSLTMLSTGFGCVGTTQHCFRWELLRDGPSCHPTIRPWLSAWTSRRLSLPPSSSRGSVASGGLTRIWQPLLAPVAVRLLLRGEAFSPSTPVTRWRSP